MELGTGSTAQRQALICVICGDKAFGYNFGAITCESCKSFYRRHSNRSEEFLCPSAGTCTINKSTRKYCPACRMQKCTQVGMKRPIYTEESVGAARRFDSNPPDGTVLPLKGTSYSSGMVSDEISRRKKSSGRVQFGSSRNSESAKSSSGKANFTIREPVKLALKRRLFERSRMGVCDRFAKLRNAKTQLPASPSELGKPTQDELDAEYAECERQLRVAVRFFESPWNTEELGGRRDMKPVAVTRACVFYSEASLRRYVRGMQTISDFSKLPHATRAAIFRKNIMEQFNIHAVVNFNTDLTGWTCSDLHGNVHENRFEALLEFGARFDMDFRQYVEQLRGFAASLRREFPTDWRLLTMVLSLLSATSFPPDSELTEETLPGMSAVNALREKYMRFLTRYLSVRFGAASSVKMVACWRILEEVRVIADLNTVVLSQLLTGTPASPPADAEESEEVITQAAVTIAPLLAETVLQSLSNCDCR